VLGANFVAPEKETGSKEILDGILGELATVLDTVSQTRSHTCVVLASTFPEFLPITADLPTRDVCGTVARFREVLLAASVPVIAVLNTDTQGAAWFVAQHCDACVYRDDSLYAFDTSTPLWSDPELAAVAATIFSYRLGGYLGKEVLLTGKAYSGSELRQRVGTVTVAEDGQALPAALRLAQYWASAPAEALVSWKKAVLPDTPPGANALSPWRDATTEESASESQVIGGGEEPIPLRSAVVTATALEGSILLVKMQDRQSKNLFSPELVAGLEEVFTHVEETPAYKVVVLSGYDSYFACGGTKDTLLSIQRGETSFTDIRVYEAALKCRIPVISAMQGHGIGAGWALGMFADLMLFSETGRYVSPYMGYGFTPGAGSTLIFPQRMGYDLGRETLFTGRSYSGAELRDRGIGLPVLPRDRVLAGAMELAKQIARAPRNRLMKLKQQFAQQVRGALEETYERELAMHARTFVGRADTLQLIRERFARPEEELRGDNGARRTEGASRREEDDDVDEAIALLPAACDVVVALGATAPSATAMISDLKTLLAQELQMREEDVAEDIQFVDLGLDSISGVSWIRKINEKYRTSIEATKVYSYPNLRQLSAYVRREAATQAGTTAGESSGARKGTAAQSVPAESAQATRREARRAADPPGRAASVPASLRKLASRRARKPSRGVGGGTPKPSEPIAVIGMAGQFPQAKNVEEFWQNIAAGRDCITAVPPRRWDMDTCYQPGAAVAGKTNSRWMGALEDYDRFDPLFFNISPTEAQSMDPQQRLFLQACWQGIEHAGYNAHTLSGSRCGVFVGCSSGDYHNLSAQQRLSAQGFTGGANAILAARISYFLNLQGPCLAIDTACSSSLVAIAHACDSLRSGASDLALAGGVHVMAGPEMHIKTAQAGMLSGEGRCFTFDRRANGFVPGEAVAVVLLKRLSQAEKDRDTIYGVIRGWGVNQDGKTNGITAPNPLAQARLQQEVYDRYGIDPTNIQLVEAHGTGTQLGDPIEVQALQDSFGRYTQNQDYCALGSVKSNIGHCLTAAGVAGFIKLVQALRHRQLPPTIHFEQLNEHIQLEGSPFYVNTRLRDWEPGQSGVRQAATSSFGFGGTNSHVVVEEYAPRAVSEPAVTAITQNGRVIVPLSARTPEQLRERARDLLEFLRRAQPTPNLLELAYTLQAGRQPMEERAAFLADSMEQLAIKLQAYVDAKRDAEGTYQGQVRVNQEPMSFITQDADVRQTLIETWRARKELSRLAQLWVKGLDFDWKRLYGDTQPRRIALPTYPFDQERYWITDSDDTLDLLPARPDRPILHPLLHLNVSDFETQSYSATFTGEEAFLTDHRVCMDGRTVHKVMPGVAYLEMTRAALADALRRWPGSLHLQDTVWLKPLVVLERTQLFISLAATQSEGEHGQADYQIYSRAAGQDIVHCRGRAGFDHRPPGRIDVERLRAQMRRATLESADVYAAFDRMGLFYGPAHRGITTIQAGEGQLLAQLRLPPAIEGRQDGYVLHPSLMDSALQALVGLTNLHQLSRTPLVPFSLDQLHMVTGCTRQMLAWVRYSPSHRSDSGVITVDIDLCDEDGKICVEMRGFACRALNDDTEAARLQVENLSSGNDIIATANAGFDSVFYQTLIDSVLSKQVSIDEAVRLG
jgi:acyl transferase domain-containing protein/enoyl-CoA hydratase/carnithine racemase/acyl carrier protein